jgi:hypothetical protein
MFFYCFKNLDSYFLYGIVVYKIEKWNVLMLLQKWSDLEFKNIPQVFSVFLYPQLKKVYANSRKTGTMIPSRAILAAVGMGVKCL